MGNTPSGRIKQKLSYSICKSSDHFMMFLGDAKGIPYYFQAARSLIGLKSVLTNQCDEFGPLRLVKTGFDMLALNI